jgi:ribosomal protein L12E/L44/L45/RPP1/RPP2
MVKRSSPTAAAGGGSTKRPQAKPSKKKKEEEEEEEGENYLNHNFDLMLCWAAQPSKRTQAGLPEQAL